MDLKQKSKFDAMFALFNLMLAGVWLFVVKDRMLGAAMITLHLSLAAFLSLMPPADERTSGWARGLRQLYPYVFWVLAWSEVGWIFNLTRPVVLDSSILAWDLGLFGTHLNWQLASWLPWSWLSEFMHFTYLSYYLLILGPVAYLAWCRRSALPEHTANLMGTYLACFAIYLCWPVLGPREFLASLGGSPAAEPGGIFAPVMMALIKAGDSAGTAFPSSHCAGSMAAALSMHSLLGRRAGSLFLTWALLITVSTVYTNNHYAVDAVAGTAIALVVWRLRAWSMAGTGERGLVGRAVIGSAGMIVAGQMGNWKRGERS